MFHENIFGHYHSLSVFLSPFVTERSIPLSPFFFSGADEHSVIMSGRYSASRPAGREHIPLYPKGFIGLRIVQLVIAVIVLGLDAFTLSILAFDGNALMAFTVST